MYTPAIGISWQIWRRVRHGAVFLAFYLPLTTIIVRLITSPGLRQQMAGLFTMPVIWLGCAALSIFCFGHEDQDTRESRFPKHTMVLPATNYTLVLWPMLLAALTVGGLWIVSALLILRPAGVPTPLWVPAAALAALLVWIQAAAIWPFGLRFVRLATLLPIGMAF